MKKKIFETTSKMYVEEREKFYHYSVLNAFYRAVALGYHYKCNHTSDGSLIAVEFYEGGHAYLIYMTPEEFSKCIVEGLNAKSN